jgi:hypothetical protein
MRSDKWVRFFKCRNRVIDGPWPSAAKIRRAVVVRLNNKEENGYMIAFTEMLDPNLTDVADELVTLSEITSAFRVHSSPMPRLLLCPANR